jgi:hypothetical protein
MFNSPNMRLQCSKGYVSGYTYVGLCYVINLARIKHNLRLQGHCLFKKVFLQEYIRNAFYVHSQFHRQSISPARISQQIP